MNCNAQVQIDLCTSQQQNLPCTLSHYMGPVKQTFSAQNCDYVLKMPTIVGILTFISMINTISEILKLRNFFICRYFSLHEQLKFVLNLVEHANCFITSRAEARVLCVFCCFSSCVCGLASLPYSVMG